MKRKLLSLTLVFVLCLSLFVPAFAAEQTELELAAAYVRQNGIMVGDGNGNLNLDAGLTRAELAVLLTRLRNGEGVLMANTAYFERAISSSLFSMIQGSPVMSLWLWSPPTA